MVTYLGSLGQLCCGVGGTQQTSTTGVCAECSQCMDHTGFAPAHGGVCFPGLHCLGSRLLCGSTVQSRPYCSCTSHVVAAQIHVLRYSARAELGLPTDSVRPAFFALLRFEQPRCAQFEQQCGEHTVPGGPCILITSPGPSCSVSWWCQESTVSGVLCLLWGAALRL